MFTDRSRTIPFNKFFFTQFSVTTNIQFIDDFLRSFLRILFTFSITNTRSIILNFKQIISNQFNQDNKQSQISHRLIHFDRFVHHLMYPT